MYCLQYIISSPSLIQKEFILFSKIMEEERGFEGISKRLFFALDKSGNRKGRKSILLCHFVMKFRVIPKYFMQN